MALAVLIGGAGALSIDRLLRPLRRLAGGDGLPRPRAGQRRHHLAGGARSCPASTCGGVRAALLAGLVLGLINALVRPVLVILTFPLTLLTLGLFLLVLNAVCLALTSRLVPGLRRRRLLAGPAGRPGRSRW